MSRSLISLVSYLVVTFLFSQNKLSDWSHLSQDPNTDAPYFRILKADFNSRQLEVIRRLDEENLIVRVTSEENLDLGTLNPVNDDWKLNLRQPRNEDTFYVKGTKELTKEVLGNFEIIGRYGNNYVLRGKLLDVMILKKSPLVLHISDESSNPSLEARIIDMNLNPNRVNKIHHSFPELEGSEMVVSIQENQFRQEDIDIVGRSIDSNIGSTTVDNHATEMATIIAGAGNSFLTGRGVAKGAEITSSDFSDVLPDADSDYQTFNIQVQNHSYGTEIESFYGIQAQAFDQSAMSNPSLQHIFSSGNQGFEVAGDGNFASLEGYANLTGNFKMAKNALVVGSVDTVGNVVPFTSNGPAFDGRVKPEVVAYSVAGSSNSAALVSGVATLLQSQYQKMNSADMPSHLTRALLINSAMDVGAKGIDFKTGYGSVNAFRSLQALTENRYFLGAISEGEQLSFPISLPENATNLKVTLSWTDQPSDVAAFKALVNDLDLKVVNSSEEETLPWILNVNPDISELSMPAVRGVDRLNNNEQVTIEVPEDLNLSIEVDGFEVSGSQNFAIAYEYELADSFEWDYPTSSDNMPYNGESGSYFRWNSTLEASTGRLEYTLDNGATWITLDEAVDLSTGQWRWVAPFRLNAEAKARMVTVGQSFETDVFTISNPIEVSIGFICSDSVRVQWDKLPAASEYEVYNMGESALELFQTTVDTALIIPDINELTDNRFAVVPVLASGKKLIPSLTLDITQQAIECFIFSFFQEVELDSGIYLNLELGTSYGIDRVTFERVTNGEAAEIAVFDDPVESTFRVLDKSPDQGNNTHRVTIDFINGERLEREVSNTFFLTELPILVFPNPVLVGDDVTILTKELSSEAPQLKLLDARGFEVIDLPVRSTQFSIPTLGLKPGIYYYKLIDGVVSYTGRVLIR